MALDTRDKRDSAIGNSLPWRMRYPVPDGTIGKADRRHLAGHYRRAEVEVVRGPFVWEAMDSFSPGFVEQDGFAPGLEAGGDFVPGFEVQDAYTGSR